MARTVADLMWADALARLARADRLHQEFFRPAPTGWEPPVDLLETDQELILMAALPGVRASRPLSSSAPRLGPWNDGSSASRPSTA